MRVDEWPRRVSNPVRRLTSQAFSSGFVQNSPDAVDPIQVLGLHENGTQAVQCDPAVLRASARLSSKKPTGSSATARCRFRRAAASKIFRLSDAKILSSSLRGGAKTTISSSGGNGVEEASVARQGAHENSVAASRQLSRAFANSPPFPAEKPLGGPERYGSGAGPRTFQTDFAQMKFVRTEVGVGGIVLIEPPDCWVAKQDAAASVRLQAMFVRIDHDRVCLAGSGRKPGVYLRRDFPPAEIAAVGGISMYPESVFLAKL